MLIALAISNLVEPGIVDGKPVREMLALTADTGRSRQDVTEPRLHERLRYAPRHRAIEHRRGDEHRKLLGVVFFCVLFGFFLARIELPHRQASCSTSGRASSA